MRRAFTLVEVVTMLVVVGLLAAAAYGLNQLNGAQRDVAAAQRVLEDVVGAQKQLAATHGVYSMVSSDLAWLDPNVAVSSGPSTGPHEVSVAVGTSGSLGVAVRSEAGRCVAVRVAPLSGGGAMSPVAVADDAECSGGSALPSGEPVATQVSPVRL